MRKNSISQNFSLISSVSNAFACRESGGIVNINFLASFLHEEPWKIIGMIFILEVWSRCVIDRGDESDPSVLELESESDDDSDVCESPDSDSLLEGDGDFGAWRWVVLGSFFGCLNDFVDVIEEPPLDPPLHFFCHGRNLETCWLWRLFGGELGWKGWGFY